MVIKLVIAGLALALVFGSCKSSNSNLSNTNMATPSGTTTGTTVTIPIAGPLPNTRSVPPTAPAGLCPPPSFALVGQRITGAPVPLLIGDPGPTAELTAGERRANLTIADGTTYTGTVSPLTMACAPTGITTTITVTFGLGYMSV